MSDAEKKPDAAAAADAAAATTTTTTTTTNPGSALFAELAAKGEKAELKHVETADKSAPVIDKDTHIQTNVHVSLVGEIESGAPKLNHVEVADKSAPHIDKDVKVRRSSRPAVMAELQEKKKPVGAIDEKKPLPASALAEIAQPHTLKETETVDKSAPVIDKDAKVGESKQPALLAELKGKKEAVTPIDERKAPAAVLEGIAQPHTLKETETVDKSAPALPKMHKVGEEKAVLAEIAKPHELKHVETADKSAPKIEEGVTVKKNAHGELLKEVVKPHELKAAETVDKSAPVIPDDAKVSEPPQSAVLKELTAKKTQTGAADDVAAATKIA